MKRHAVPDVKHREESQPAVPGYGTSSTRRCRDCGTSSWMVPGPVPEATLAGAFHWIEARRYVPKYLPGPLAKWDGILCTETAGRNHRKSYPMGQQQQRA